MSQPLTASLMVTGSTALRLLWSDLAGVSSYQIFRATTNSQPGSPLTTVAAGVGVFNDHGAGPPPGAGLAPATKYYYWVEDQNGALLAGPLTATTNAAPVKGPLIADMQDAIVAWVVGVTGYPAGSVMWSGQPGPVPPAPRVTLDIWGPTSRSLTASLEQSAEAVGSMQQWSVSVLVASKVPDPNELVDDAFQMAQDLGSSLDDPSVALALNAAGIGIGDRQQVQNLSAALETGFERKALFDFDINIRNVYPVTVPLTIETVTPINSTVTP